MRLFGLHGPDGLTELVLIEVNEIRAEVGREPISKLKRGEPGSAFDCPIANSIGPNTCVTSMIRTSTRPGITNHFFERPPAIKKWISRFDGGRYKEYRF